jgi:hypothetical protein
MDTSSTTTYEFELWALRARKSTTTRSAPSPTPTSTAAPEQRGLMTMSGVLAALITAVLRVSIALDTVSA